MKLKKVMVKCVIIGVYLFPNTGLLIILKKSNEQKKRFFFQESNHHDKIVC